ncbi:uncharacterized protein si:ch211-244b2.4 isoform X2 [Acanthochromis polyacanthus]|uniref:uncharacterized protein si:ch211-244b2.4 isoform X2 n=1 Tax=Acanthochromis polyacanthus TaxID=80966 RepID=UPI002233EBEA|nr:uncharacterized protein si:ch211-244b2.4 isoform X2 [Acanthochromis polyacanthus]
MASVGQSDEEDYSESESDVSEESDSEDFSDLEAGCQVYAKEPCKYYNGGGCRDGSSCSYLHICKYYLNGNCHYGSSCKLNHNKNGGRRSSGASSRASDQSTSSSPKLTDGRYFQWQLNDGSGWTDIDNDHVLEAQYSLPHTKSIKIYNTPYGAVSVDFKRMRVQGKRLKVRRLDDGNTVWLWYCTLRRKWMKYGAKGNPGPVNCSDIEKKFQSNPTSSFTFSIGAQTYEIRFREMRQVGKKKRKVTRRPEYRQQQQQQQQQQAAAGVFQAASVLQNMAVGSKPVWQFEGDSGRWHEFKDRHGNECTVTSDDMERKYQQNPRDSMIFKVKGHSYKLDFGAMIQTNLKTQRTRRIRRVLV